MTDRIVFGNNKDFEETIRNASGNIGVKLPSSWFNWTNKDGVGGRAIVNDSTDIVKDDEGFKQKLIELEQLIGSIGQNSDASFSKVETRIKEFDEIFKKQEEKTSQLQINSIGAIGLFLSAFTFITGEIGILKSASTWQQLVSLSFILMGGLMLFVSMFSMFLRSISTSNNETNIQKTFKTEWVFCVISGILFLSAFVLYVWGPEFVETLQLVLRILGSFAK